MGWDVFYYEGFKKDLQRWADSDGTLGEEIIKKCESIEEDPFKGDVKPGGPIADCRSVYLRDQTYAIVYENIPDPMKRSLIDSIEELHFYGVLKHDNQDRAKSGTESKPVVMVKFEVSVPSENSGKIYSALKEIEGIHINDNEVEWASPAIFIGQYRRDREGQFETIVSDGEILMTEKQSAEDFL